jgi:hypothetical protein
MKHLRTNILRVGLFSTLLLSAVVSFAQVKIGNNPTTINANALLDVESASKGILFPRLPLTATTNPSPLTAHVAGMQVYNTASGTDVEPGIYYNDGTKWIRVGAEADEVFIYGPGAPTGSCTTGTIYVDTLEDSNTEGNTWSCVAGAWVDYVPKPGPNTTPFYLAKSTVDAKGNKSSAIYRRGLVGLGRVTNPRASLHTEGLVLITRNGQTHTGLSSGTHNYNGIVNYYNTTTRNAYIAVQNNSASPNLYLSKDRASGGDVFIRFNMTSAGTTQTAGSISRTSGWNISYNTTSDGRLKENIKTTHYGIRDLMKVGVMDYNYISDKKKESQTGFIAQELYKIYPEAVTVGGKDPKENPWTVDYSKVTPLLVKAIQDQQKEIESLKAKLAGKDVFNAQEVAALKDLLGKQVAEKAASAK